MMSHEGAAGCVQASINIDSGEVQSHRSVTIEQCSIVTEYNDLNLKLHPATGGPMAWIKLPTGRLVARRDSSRAADRGLHLHGRVPGGHLVLRVVLVQL